MFKTLENKWNSHTPTYLHARTKENLLFQLGMTAGIIVVLIGWDAYETRQLKKARLAPCD